MNRTANALLDAVLDRKMKREKKPGPVKWCPTCGRKHQRRGICDLSLRTRIAKSGREVKRWAR